MFSPPISHSPRAQTSTEITMALNGPIKHVWILISLAKKLRLCICIYFVSVLVSHFTFSAMCVRIRPTGTWWNSTTTFISLSFADSFSASCLRAAATHTRMLICSHVNWYDVRMQNHSPLLTLSMRFDVFSIHLFSIVSVMSWICNRLLLQKFSNSIQFLISVKFGRRNDVMLIVMQITNSHIWCSIRYGMRIHYE